MEYQETLSIRLNELEHRDQFVTIERFYYHLRFLARSHHWLIRGIHLELANTGVRLHAPHSHTARSR